MVSPVMYLEKLIVNILLPPTFFKSLTESTGHKLQHQKLTPLYLYTDFLGFHFLHENGREYLGEV